MGSQLVSSRSNERHQGLNNCGVFQVVTSCKPYEGYMAKTNVGLESYNPGGKDQEKMPLRLSVRNISSQRNNARGGGRI